MNISKNGRIVIVLVLTVIAICAGCSNFQSSSMEEAKYVVEQLDDFQEHVQYFSLKAMGILPPGAPKIYISEPELSCFHFIHVIIYQNKNKNYYLVFLDDSRPPEIITKTVFGPTAPVAQKKPK